MPPIRPRSRARSLRTPSSRTRAARLRAAAAPAAIPVRAARPIRLRSPLPPASPHRSRSPPPSRPRSPPGRGTRGPLRPPTTRPMPPIRPRSRARSLRTPSSRIPPRRRRSRRPTTRPIPPIRRPIRPRIRARIRSIRSRRTRTARVRTAAVPIRISPRPRWRAAPGCGSRASSGRGCGRPCGPGRADTGNCLRTRRVREQPSEASGFLLMRAHGHPTDREKRPGCRFAAQGAARLARRTRGRDPACTDISMG